MGTRSCMRTTAGSTDGGGATPLPVRRRRTADAPVVSRRGGCQYLSSDRGGRGARTRPTRRCSPPMTHGAMTPLSTLRAGGADALDAPDGTRRRGPSGYLLLNVGGWLLFGAAMMIGSLDVAPW